MKKALLIALFLVLNLFPQKFAWLTDVHIGADGAESYLGSAIEYINKQNDIDFVILTGDITEKGLVPELAKAKEEVSKLNKPWYAIPGNHDMKWSDNGGREFVFQFNDDRFVFKKNDVLFIGVNSGIIHRGGSGHIKPEDLKWMREKLESEKPYKEVYFFVHHPLTGDLDNAPAVHEVLKTVKRPVFFCGHGHSNKKLDYNGIPGFMGIATLKKYKNPSGFNIVDFAADSIVITTHFLDDEKTEQWAVLKKKDAVFGETPVPDKFTQEGVEILKTNDLAAAVVAEPVFEEGKILVTTLQGRVILFDSLGNELWRTKLSAPVTGAGTITGNRVIVGATNGDLYSLDAATGDVVQTIGLDEAVTSQLVVIDAERYGKKVKAVVVGTASGKLYCYETMEFSQLWVNDFAEGMIQSKPLVYKDKIIYGAWDGYLYSVDAKKGLLNWRWSENPNFYFSPAGCRPATDGKTVYVVTPFKQLYAVDLLLGSTKWSTDKYAVWESVTLSSDATKLYIRSLYDNFFIADAATGKQINKYELKMGTDASPGVAIEEGNSVIFGSGNGNIYKVTGKKADKILRLGLSKTMSPLSLGNGKILAMNMDGKMTIFRLSDEKNSETKPGKDTKSGKK